MSLNHTPGPWKALGARVISDYRPTERYNIADCDNHKPYVTDDIGEANARLISAAPELLSCLKELHDIVWAECPSLLDEDRGGNARLDMAIENALSKAEKEKPL